MIIHFKSFWFIKFGKLWVSKTHSINCSVNGPGRVNYIKLFKEECIALQKLYIRKQTYIQESLLHFHSRI